MRDIGSEGWSSGTEPCFSEHCADFSIFLRNCMTDEVNHSLNQLLRSLVAREVPRQLMLTPQHDVCLRLRPATRYDLCLTHEGTHTYWHRDIIFSFQGRGSFITFTTILGGNGQCRGRTSSCGIVDENPGDNILIKTVYDRGDCEVMNSTRGTICLLQQIQLIV